jgi:hypothetical protein
VRDYLQVVKKLEGFYSKCRGSQSIGGVAQQGDEELRQNLVGYANYTFDELEKAQRWRRGFQVQTAVTTPGTATITLAEWLQFHRIYWRESTGQIVPMELVEQREARLLYGDGANAARGRPRMYSILANDTLQIFPAPDAGGPDGGNYTLQVEYYNRLSKIVETTGTTAASTVLTVPSTVYLAANGISAANAAGAKVVIRTAGAATGLVAPLNFDDFLTTWSAFPLATTVTLGAQPDSVVTSQQVFFNATNWLIDLQPQVLLFAMLREIANYLKDTTGYSTWEGRYQKALADLEEWDAQSRHDQEVFASGISGQREGQFRGINGSSWGTGYW